MSSLLAKVKTTYNVEDIGFKVHVLNDDTIIIESDDTVNDHEAMRYVLEYIHTDRIAFKDGTDPVLLAKIEALATKLGITRLAIIAKNKQPSTTTKAAVPDSPWWPNNNNAYTLWRGVEPNDDTHYDLSDLTLICTDRVIDDMDSKQVEQYRTRADCSYWCSLSKLSKNLFEGESMNEQRKKLEFTISDCSKEILECFVKFTYTRQFQLSPDEAVKALYVADTIMAPDVFIEVESLVMRHLKKEQVDEFEPIAKQLNSTRILQLIEDIRKSGQDLTQFATNNT